MFYYLKYRLTKIGSLKLNGQNCMIWHQWIILCWDQSWTSHMHKLMTCNNIACNMWLTIDAKYVIASFDTETQISVKIMQCNELLFMILQVKLTLVTNCCNYNEQILTWKLSNCYSILLSAVDIWSARLKI